MTVSGNKPALYINPWKRFNGSFIPNPIMRSTELAPAEKLCYARLSQYAGRGGTAWPKQETLAEEIGVSCRQVRRLLENLEKKGFIETQTPVGVDRLAHKTNRYLFLLHPTLTDDVDITPGSATDVLSDTVTDVLSDTVTDVLSDTVTDVLSKERESVERESVERKEIKTLSGKPDVTSLNKELSGYKTTMPDKTKTIIPAIVDHLNTKAGTKYRNSSAKTRSLIRARLKEGFTIEDFKTVIDKKVSQWKGDAKMAPFIRPETLFGTKFEAYLNERAGPPGAWFTGLVDKDFSENLI